MVRTVETSSRYDFDHDSFGISKVQVSLRWVAYTVSPFYAIYSDPCHSHNILEAAS